MAKNPEHSFSATATHQLLAGRFPAGWLGPARKSRCGFPRTTSPSRMSPSSGASMPIIGTAVPDPADVALLVEVSDSTLALDRGKKLSAYAADGIPVYWIVNLVDRQVEVYSRPGKAGYRSRKDLHARPACPDHDRRSETHPDRRR